MANYYSTTRTNYFRVKDPDAFRDFMKTVWSSEDSVQVWEERKGYKDDVPRYGFGCYSEILGIGVGEPDTYGLFYDYDYEAFCQRLSEFVAEDDAIIIMEAGNEKLRYVVGTATVITSTSVEFLNLSDLAVKSAAKMLNNPDWKTCLEY